MEQVKGIKPGSWVILRSLPSHRARWDNKPALILPDGELTLRDIKNWNGEMQRMLGYRVLPQGRDPSKPIRVPMVCVYAPDFPLDRHGNPVQMGEQAVVRSEGRAPTLTNVGTSENPQLEVSWVGTGNFA